MKHFLILIIVVAGYSCTSRHVPEVEERDTTITLQNAYTELFLDSLQLEEFLKKGSFAESDANQFRSFYNTRNYQYAWFFSDGPAEQLYNFWALQSNFISYSGDSSLTNPVIDYMLDSLEQGKFPELTPAQRNIAELEVTSQFFKYANRAYQGDSTLNTDSLKWFIPRKKIDVVATLDSLVLYKGKDPEKYEPLNLYYRLLKQQLVVYSEIQKSGGWDSVHTTVKKVLLNDSVAVVSAVKKRLSITKEFAKEDTSWVFNDTLYRAIVHYQERNGLKADGEIGPAVLRSLNVPIENRIQQMLINLERMRWVPAKLEGDYLLVNIPEFKLHIFEEAKPIHHMDVVVGTNQHNTVIFYGDLRYVVFSPYWNIPPGILKNEVLPAMAKNENYLKRNNMEIAGYRGTTPIIRQKPGPNNSLGKVKFLFPNNHNIYMHDTPAKKLFGESRRNFSHGCIRLADPAWLANFLLRKDSLWNEAAIEKAMNANKEKYVTLQETIPVYIGYFTAWVDSYGRLNFRDDVYGHDKRTSEKMFKQ